jgi:hypothetical protein
MSATVSAQEVTAQFVEQFMADCDAVGLTSRRLAVALKYLVNAKKTDTFKAKDEHYNDSGRLIRTEEKVLYSKPLADNAARRAGTEMALNVRGIPTKSPQSPIDIRHSGDVNIMGLISQAMTANGEDVDD